MICRFRGCSSHISAVNELCGADFCGPAHRSAEHTASRHDEAVTLRAEALEVIRNISTAHLVGDQARILTLAFKAS